MSDTNQTKTIRIAKTTCSCCINLSFKKDITTIINYVKNEEWQLCYECLDEYNKESFGSCRLCSKELTNGETYHEWVSQKQASVDTCYICHLNVCNMYGLRPQPCKIPCDCGGFGCDTVCNDEEDMLDELATNDL